MAGFADDGPAATTTTLATSIPGAFTTRPPVFTATVETESSAPATGTVEFVADGLSLGQAPVFTRDGHRIAVMGGATLGVGKHTITARYGGADSHLPSESEPLSQMVTLGDYSVQDMSIFDPAGATAVNSAGKVVGSFLTTIFKGGRSLTARIGFIKDSLQGDWFGLGLWTVPTAVNEAGEVVGRASATGGPFHAFLYSSRTFQTKDLGTLGGGTSQALAINNAGQVVGTSSTASGATHGFLFSAGTLADLGTLGGTGSAALAINASGSAAGYADLANGERHAAYYTSSWHDLGTLGGTRSAAVTMNDAGQVAGTSLLGGDHDAHAFLWQDGQFTDLAGPGGPPTVAARMNDAGQVVGWTIPPGAGSVAFEAPSPRRAFLYSGGLDVLGTLRGGTSQALAISNAGLVVGVSDGRAFVSNGGALRDLGTRGGPTSIAHAINDQGLIVGAADLSSGQRVAVAWRPVAVHDLSVAAATGVVGRATVLTATLKASGAPASGERIDFALGGASVGSALTNATGKAVLTGVSLPGFPIGTYPAAVRATHASSFTVAIADLVVSADHPPVATPESYEITGPVSVPAPGVLANDSDVDGDALSAVLVAGPDHGTVTLAADGSFTYTPDPGSDPGGLPGDAFTYEVLAGGLSSNVVTMSLVGFVQPVLGGVVSAVPITIDNSPETKSHPRLSGDLLTYSTTAHEVRYYDFAAGHNAVVPHDPEESDDTPDVDAGRLLFSRYRHVTPVGLTLTVFDIASGQVTTVAPDYTLVGVDGWSIGGDTVAFKKSKVVSVEPPIVTSHIAAWDLATSTELPLDDDGLYITFVGDPRVSRDASTVVWTRCGGSDCDLFQARRSGGGWTNSVVVGAVRGLSTDPDTDGNWIVYAAGSLSQPTRIHRRPVATPDDRVLDLAGSQRGPSVDGGVVSFTGGPGSVPDVFVYVIATNTLYQVTQTPTVTETSSAVSVLPNGDIRVTWLEGALENVVRAVTFTPGH